MWERTITMNSAGKTFSLTGWKIGWAIGPAELVGAIQAVHQFVTFASGTPFQEAIATALEYSRTNGYYDRLAREYAHGAVCWKRRSPAPSCRCCRSAAAIS